MKLRISKKGKSGKLDLYRVIFDSLRYFGDISIYEIREENMLTVEFDCYEDRARIERAVEKAKTFAIKTEILPDKKED